MQGNAGFPKFFWYGTEGDSSMMITELLGPSLEDLFQFCGKKVSTATSLFLADQMVIFYLLFYLDYKIRELS